MPVYVYHCDKCLKQTEIFLHYTDDPITVCPECGETKLQKQYRPIPVHFKGYGYYVTDKYDPAQTRT